MFDQLTDQLIKTNSNLPNLFRNWRWSAAPSKITQTLSQGSWASL